MKVYTTRSQIREVADRWRDQYTEFVGRKRRWKSLAYGPDAEDIYNRLVALDGATATPADVAAIIGNDSWILPVSCYECGRVAPALAQFTVHTGSEELSIEICAECLRRAAEALDEVVREGQHV